MIVVYCYLEIKTYKVFKFHKNSLLLQNKRLSLLSATLQKALHLKASKINMRRGNTVAVIDIWLPVNYVSKSIFVSTAKTNTILGLYQHLQIWNIYVLDLNDQFSQYPSQQQNFVHRIAYISHVHCLFLKLF